MKHFMYAGAGMGGSSGPENRYLLRRRTTGWPLPTAYSAF